MKPSIEEIFEVTLQVLQISKEKWERIRHTRQWDAVQLVQAASFVSMENGYSIKDIAEFFDRQYATILYDVTRMKELCFLYKDSVDIIDKIYNKLNYRHCHTYNAYLARSCSGLLTMSPTVPERMGGYWVAVGAKPYIDQESFPQITWESGPAKVKITVTLDNDEKM